MTEQSTPIGDNFCQGALIGGVIAGLNHSLHKITSPKDIIVLLAEEGGSGFGHMGTVVGDDENGWYYISKDGRGTNKITKEKNGNELTGGKPTYNNSKKN